MMSDEMKNIEERLKKKLDEHKNEAWFVAGFESAVAILKPEIAIRDKDLKNSKFLRYLDATRNEIARFDQYAYTATPKFRYNTDDLDYFAKYHTYDELKEEQRRLRWLHILEHSMEDSVRNLRNKIVDKFTYSEFSELIARAYSLVSKEIHTLIYDVTFGGEYCPKITADTRVNSCINVIMEEVELDMGTMVPRAKKPKLVPDTSR